MKIIAIVFAVCAFAVAVFATCWALSMQEPDVVSIGGLWVLTLTLVVLVCYAYDTNSIARVTRDRWQREGVLGATYGMVLTGENGGEGRTMFQIRNPSNLIVHARVNCNFRLYGQPVKAGSLYDGEERWVVFPQQDSQGWFTVESLLRQGAKDVEDLCRERTAANRKVQLTMLLELEFQDELGGHRNLPARHHYFDFVRWVWIPHLGESKASI